MPFNVSGTENTKIKLDDFTITNSKKEKLLGIIFDDKLEYQYNIENLCKKASCRVLLLLSICHKRKLYSMPFLSHSLATALWFACVIAEHSIAK